MFVSDYVDDPTTCYLDYLLLIFRKTRAINSVLHRYVNSITVISVAPGLNLVFIRNVA